MLYAKLELSVAAKVTNKELSRATQRVYKNTTYLAKVIAAETQKKSSLTTTFTTLLSL